MPTSIPLPVDTPRTTFRVTLDGTDYQLRLDYHVRQDRWFLDVLTADGDVIIAGVKIVCTWSLLRGLVDARRPPGAIFCISTGPSDDGPTFATLGRSVSLLYYTAAEVAAL